MFAVVANGRSTLCKTQRQLDFIVSVYPYPKFRKVRDEAEGRAWLRANTRGDFAIQHLRYGATAKAGYVGIDYYINGNVYCNLDKRRIGNVCIEAEKGVCIDNRSGYIKMKIKDVELEDQLITHHMIVIKRILKIVGEYVDVDIVVPDMSVYLAITKYTGKNYIIRGVQRDIAKRLGAVSYTVRSEI